MVISGVNEKYKAFLDQQSTRWEFGNDVLYKMCKEHPHHDQENVIVGKMWLIGRSYAAAIERRKNDDGYQGDDFYYDVVAPKMLEIGTVLDDRLDRLRNSNKPVIEDIAEILSLHKFLMDSFFEITGLEKRSLASKYLHFHCPEKFYIYDSRARNAIRKIIKRPDKSILSNIVCDAEYGDYVCRMLELRQYFFDNLGLNETPRALDSFLLSGV